MNLAGEGCQASRQPSDACIPFYLWQFKTMSALSKTIDRSTW